ncbi:prostaglandin E receptor 1c (subtype EP1) isoform X1 [Lates calcarifer]|uniref:Thromboxane A2 receptor n=2 Tax=Lates calcarifer TaxID=8187 RepID=A0AAJ7QMX9_LATCA|nr:prostaglandin E receptor 1c (subtype EP1) isoform X1 [Lates calcarifer]
MAFRVKTPSVLITLFSTSSTPSILHQNMKINSSESPWLNSSTSPVIRPSGIGMSCFTMTFGAISNLTALGILAKSRVRFRRQSKAPFLLLTVALLLADLGGHVILGAFAIYLHMDQRYKMQVEKPTTFCQVFGASMVFFGLCPLLLGCAMAIERFVAITQPFFHTAMITVTHARRVVLFLSSLALMLAVLPLFAVGTYTIQFPGTWCFLPIYGPQSKANTNLALAFSCLGLIALTLSLLCNILSGLALLQARIRPHNANTKSTARCIRRLSSASTSSLFCSLDVEMMAQLAVITVVSCVCWSPFLIHILVTQLNQSSRASTQEQDGFILLGLRMASWNQILDPWVYILLRKAVLSRVCCACYTQRPRERTNSFCADSHRQTFSLQ